MSQIVGIIEEVAQAGEVIIEEAKDEGEEPSKVNFSLIEISKAAMAQAKAEEDLGCVPNPDSKVAKTWDLHEGYRWVWIGCVHGHNSNVDSFYTLKENKQLDNFVNSIDYTILKGIRNTRIPFLFKKLLKSSKI